MLKFENASVGYGQRVIIDDIDLDVKQGEIVTLIGPNGSGKSTILKTITKQLKLVSGNIFVADKNVFEIKDKELAKLVSMVMTERLNTELMTCREVVATGRYPYTNNMGILTPKDWEIVDSAIARVDAEEVTASDFMKISDGQKQRIMLARALCQEPQLMILDEPTSYLDLKYKLSLITTIKELSRKDKITIFMSLHELELAKAVSDRVICVKDNKIDRIGTSKEIFEGDYISKLFGVDLKQYSDALGIKWNF